MSPESAPDPAATPFYAEVAALDQARTPFVLVVLCEALGSVPQDAGAKMIVTPDGRRRGTVGGGRIEARAVEFAREYFRPPAAGAAAPRFVHWTLKGDVGMTCGGAVKLYFEPHHVAPWSIALFGAGHVAQALVPLLLPLDCVVHCFDPRPEWLARLPAAPNLAAGPGADAAGALDALPDDAFVICLTQGHATDRPILQRALATRNFPFLGAIGSAAKAAVLRQELIASGLTPERAAAFHCPLGLPFGTNHPQEIALSIAAQLLTERDRRRASPPATRAAENTPPASPA